MVSNKTTADQKKSKVQCKKLFVLENLGIFFFLLFWCTRYAKAILEGTKISVSTEDVLELLFLS